MLTNMENNDYARDMRVYTGSGHWEDKIIHLVCVGVLSFIGSRPPLLLLL
jgi:hypothetical protein